MPSTKDKNMKSIVLLFLLVLPPSNDQVNWTFDFEQAKAKALETDKIILVVFSGSDWCKPCIQLHRDLFESNEFIEYAGKELVLVKADFPYSKRNRLSKQQTEHNELLAGRYNPNGEFPLAVFTDTTGKVLGAFGYDKTKKPQDYILQFNKLLK